MMHNETWRTPMTVKACAICVAIVAGISSASAADQTVRVGVLACNVDGNDDSFITLSKDVQCDYWPVYGDAEHYRGTISNLSAGLGAVGDGKISWDVLAPDAEMNPHALAGAYGRLASARPQWSTGTLVGGVSQSIALRPVSQSGDASFGKFAAGVGGLLLRPDSQSYLS
jgi:uncharacterized protein DUF992